MRRKVTAWGAQILSLLEHPIIRVVFLAVSLIAMGILLYSQWQSLEQSLDKIKWGYVAAAVLPGMVFVFTGLLVWTAMLVRMEPTVAVQKLRRSFFLGQLSKYIPGGFWNFVSVSAFAKSSGVGRKKLFLSQLYAVMTSIGTGLTLGGGLLLGNAKGSAELFWLGFVLTLAGIVSVIAVLISSGSKSVVDPNKAVRFSRPYFSNLSLAAAGWALVGWFFAGSHVTLLALSLGASLTLDMMLTMVIGFSIAWSIGAATPIAPSGIGVRESIFFSFVSIHLSFEDSVIVVVSSRIVLSLIDLVFGTISWFHPRAKRNSEEKGTQDLWLLQVERH